MIGTIEQDVVILDDVKDERWFKVAVMLDIVGFGIKPACLVMISSMYSEQNLLFEILDCTFNLHCADTFLCVDYLAMQVGDFNRVAIDQAERPNPSTS